jgi:hypothetical protein
VVGWIIEFLATRSVRRTDSDSLCDFHSARAEEPVL